ncbi:MAG: hypothetical protein IMW91_03460 [Firmicutes bacterium]|nr:hypothetical protein [Bacillota bacterium]
MAEELFSEAWLHEFVRNGNNGPTAREREEKLPNYWEAVAKQGATYNFPTGLILKAEPAKGYPQPLAALLPFQQGRVIGERLCSVQEASQQEMVIQIAPSVYERVNAGEEEIGEAMMYRDLLLAKGDVATFFLCSYFIQEWFGFAMRRTAFRLPAMQTA